MKLLFLFCIGMLNAQAQNKKNDDKAVEGIFATISTNKGDITVQFDSPKAPITVANFIALAEGKNTFVTDEKLKGKPFMMV
jgi:hypothetical protein